MTLFGKWVFVDVIKLRILDVVLALKPITSVLIRERGRGVEKRRNMGRK